MIEYTQRKNEMKRNVNIIVVFNQNKSKGDNRYFNPRPREGSHLNGVER